MKNNNLFIENLVPSQQIFLYNYNKYFQLFSELYLQKKLPNVVLLSGLKGIGKSTFVYHFINFLLSKDSKNNYSLKNYSINKESKDFQLISKNLHPNFFLLDNVGIKKNIEIDQVRNLIKYLNKSTYADNLKFVMINNSESLNKNSSNALLKNLEEPTEKTYFFIIHNSAMRISDTIKSRCTEFKIFFHHDEMKNSLDKLIDQYNITENIIKDLYNNLYYETPGNIINFFQYKESNLVEKKNISLYLKSLIDAYIKDKNLEILNYILMLIENFYFSKFLKNSKNISYHYNKIKILKKIKQMIVFNLDPKNIFFEINLILNNEK